MLYYKVLHSSKGRSNTLVITARKRSLGQGNIFAPACHSVHGGGGTWSRWGVPASEGGAWWIPPPPRMATAADGTHPTGMHSC